MPKESVSESYDSEEDYGEESELELSQDDQPREVDAANVLNYESDSDEESEDELGAQLREQKEEISKDPATWGKTKKQYYQKDDQDSGMSSSEADEDLLAEAQRLQEIRRKKLAKQMAQRDAEEQSEPSDEERDGDHQRDSSSDEDDESDDQPGRKLGDALFESDQEGEQEIRAAELKMMDPEVQRQIIESDSPELVGLLQEFKESLHQANDKLKPLLDRVKSKQLQSTAAGMSYLEMKYNLLMSYCTFLAFYLLMKVEGRSVEGHPVVLRLAHIKTLFEKLKPLDQKLQYQVDKMLRLSEENKVGGQSGVQQNALKFKPNIKDLQMPSEEEDDQDDPGSEMEADYGSESEVEDDLQPTAKESSRKKRKAASDSDSDDEDTQVYKAPKHHAVVFEDKADKKARQKEAYEKKKMSKSSFVQEMRRELADEPEEVHMGLGRKTKASKYEEMIEGIEQENFKRVQMTKKEQRAMRNARFEDMQDKLENLDDDFAAIQSIVKRTGRREDRSAIETEERDAEKSRFTKSLKKLVEKPKKEKVDFSKLKAANIKGDAVYEGQKEKLREKKAARKEHEKVVKGEIQKEITQMESNIQRNVNHEIMKAKGLQRKRPVKDKTPRVKKRHQYEKIVKKHKARVQEFQDGKPQGLYSGESQGLRSGLKKSTKLN